ncbi:MAG: choice-of-anchor I family protein [Pseudomonadales bacterium]|nr:choice-of-anchor I family protein [Pseudomonadales bacterium]
MNFKLKGLAAAMICASFALAGCEGDDGSPGATGPAGATGATGAAGTDGVDASRTAISLSFLGRGFNPDAAFDGSAAEIVDFDPATGRAFVVNAQAGGVDIFSLAAPANPAFVEALDVAADVAAAIDGIAAADLGAVNSVAIHSASNTLAVVVAAEPETNNGYAAFYQASDGTFLAAVEVGALPDSVAISPDGNTVVVANEGQPSGDYTVDPDGSISVIDISGGASTVAAANVTSVTFDGLEAADIPGVRISGPGGDIAAALEPEYVAISDDGATAYVSLQENNAIAEVDLETGTLTDVWALGFKDHRNPGNELDVSNRDDVINIRNWPVYGVYMPDGIATYTVNGVPYVVTANEGDSRDYAAHVDELRIRDITDNGTNSIDLPLADVLSFGADYDQDGDVDSIDFLEDEGLGRLKIITDLGVTGANCDATGTEPQNCTYEALYAFGARSFSIFNAETQTLAFDSGNDFERITAERNPENFNATNDENNFDNRSDDKGPEPEGAELGVIDGRTYAFINLERVGGVMVYDVTEPERSEFVQYITNRDFSLADADLDAGVTDLGPEITHFISAEDSPSGVPLLLVSNEVSGTLTVYQIDARSISN